MVILKRCILTMLAVLTTAATPTTQHTLPPYRMDAGDFVFTAEDVVVPARYLDHDGEWQAGDVLVPRGYWIVHPLDHAGATTKPLHHVKRSPWGPNGKLRQHDDQDE